MEQSVAIPTTFYRMTVFALKWSFALSFACCLLVVVSGPQTLISPVGDHIKRAAMLVVPFRD